MTELIFGSLLLIAGLVLLRAARRGSLGQRNPQGNAIGRIVGLVLIPAGVYVASLAFWTIVSTGTVGVQILFSRPLPGYLGTGFNTKLPWVDVVEMNTQTQEYTMSGRNAEGQVKGDDAITVHGSDQMSLDIEATVLYHLDRDRASDLYQQIGTEYVSRIIRPESRSVITTVATSWSGIDLYSTHRQEYQDSINGRLRPILAVRGIVLEQVLLRDVKPPQGVVDAINRKKQAQQDAEQMEYVLDKERKEADRKRVEAGGIADFQRIVSQGISTQLLEWKGIEATERIAQSQNSKVIVIGSGKSGLPLILGQ